MSFVLRICTTDRTPCRNSSELTAARVQRRPVFVAVDTLLDRRIAGESGLDGQQAVAQGARGGVGWALLAAVTLDGVPENLA